MNTDVEGTCQDVQFAMSQCWKRGISWQNVWPSNYPIHVQIKTWAAKRSYFYKTWKPMRQYAHTDYIAAFHASLDVDGEDADFR